MVFDYVLQGMLGALHSFTTADFWIAITIGSVIGLIFGLIPGISGMLALALMLPFVFRMSPEQALPMMMAVLGTQFFGGAISAILINLPGSPGNAATLIDGFPMTQKGQAGRAIGASQAASALGSLMTAALALIMIPAMLPIVMNIISADMVFFILLGITFIAVLSTESMIKGLLSGGLGLIIAFIGFQDSTGLERYTFGVTYLYDGIELIPLVLGLFGMPEMIALATRGGTLAKTAVKIGGRREVWQGVMETFHHWPLVVRSNLIGFVVGLIPGLGASPATFIAYGQAKQSSKHPEEFGKGSIEGVIAPEAANNACEAGALLTTVALGIPGSAIMALLIGGMMMVGLVPGPSMLTEHMDLSLSLIWVIALTGILGSVTCILLAPYMSKVALIPGSILIPAVTVVAFVGGYAYQERYNDLIVLVIFTVLGLVMRRYGFNRPALFLAFILGGLFEQYFFLAVKTAGPLFFMRPLSLSLMVIILAVLSFDPMRRAWQRRKAGKQS